MVIERKLQTVYILWKFSTNNVKRTRVYVVFERNQVKSLQSQVNVLLANALRCWKESSSNSCRSINGTTNQTANVWLAIDQLSWHFIDILKIVLAQLDAGTTDFEIKQITCTHRQR